MPSGVDHEPRAAVPAGVQERAREAVVVADHEHALAADVERQVLPALAHLVDVTGADPAAAEQIGTFPLEDGGVRERRAGQHRRLLQRQAACARHPRRRAAERGS